MNPKFALKVIKQGQTQKVHVVTPGAGMQGQAVVVQALDAARFQLADIVTLSAPEKLQMKRVGKDLQIALPGGDVDAPDIVVKDYYAVQNPSVQGQSLSGEWNTYNTADLVDAAPQQLTTPEGAASANSGLGASQAAAGASAAAGGMSMGTLAAIGLSAAALGGGGGGSGGASPTTTPSDLKGLDLLKAYANAVNGTGVTAPTLATYKDAGVKALGTLSDTALNANTEIDDSSVTALMGSTWLQALNSALDQQVGDSTLTVDKLKTMAASYYRILSEADGVINTTKNTDVKSGASNDPVAGDYTNIGATVGSTLKSLDLLNDFVGLSSKTAVDTVDKINTVAKAAENVMLHAKGITTATSGGPALYTTNAEWVAGLTALGITGVNTGNVAAVKKAIDDSTNNNNGDGAAVNTVAKINDLVKGVNALQTLKDYANATNGTGVTAPTLATDVLLTVPISAGNLARLTNGTHSLTTRLVNPLGDVGLPSGGLSLTVTGRVPASMSSAGAPTIVGENKVFNSSAVNQAVATAGTQSTTNSWLQTNLSFSVNSALAPDGSMSADKIIPTTTSGTHYVQTYGMGNLGNTTSSTYQFSAGKTYTFSIYAKADGHSKIETGFNSNIPGSARSTFDLTAGTTTTPTNGSAKITAVGDGWFRLSETFTATGTQSNWETNLQTYVLSDAGASGFTGDGVKGVLLWGAQVEESPTATPYIPTTTAPASTPDTTLTATELIRGTALKAQVSSALAGDRLEVLVDGQSWTTPIYSDAFTADVATSTAVWVNLPNMASLSDGSHTLSFRLVNPLGDGGTPTSTLSVMVNTSSADTLNGPSGSAIRGGGGDDTINLTSTGSGYTLLYDTLSGSSADARGGNGGDTVNNFHAGAFGSGGDKIDISKLLTGFVGQGADNANANALISAGLVHLMQNGANLELQVDRDGSANGASLTTLVTLTNVNMSAWGASETDALTTMLTNKNLVVL